MDLEDDEKVGIKSTARIFKDDPYDFRLLSFASLTILFLAISGIQANFINLGSNLIFQPFAIALLFASLHLGWQYSSLEKYNREKCLSLFRSNQYFGLLIFFGLFLTCLMK